MTALFAFVFALNPVYGLIASQVANATNGPAITNMRLDSEAGSVYDSNKIQVLQGMITDIRVDVQSVNELDDKMTVDVYRSSARLANITLAKKTTNGYALTTSQNTANFDDGLYTLTALAKKDGDVVDTYNMVVRVDNVPDSHNVSNIIPAPGSVVTGKATPEATVENPETVSKVNMRVFKLGATNESTSFYLVRRDNSRFYKNAEDSSKLPNGKYFTIVEVTDVYGNMTTTNTNDNPFTINNTQFRNVMPQSGSVLRGVQPERTLRATITGLNGNEDVRGFLYNDRGEVVMPNAPMKAVRGQPNVYAYSRTLDTAKLPPGNGDGSYQLVIEITDTEGDKVHYNSSRTNHLIVIDNNPSLAPNNLTWTGTEGSSAVGGITDIKDGVLGWDHPDIDDVDYYIYKFWTDFDNHTIDNPWTTETHGSRDMINGRSIETNFYSDGTYYFCVQAVDLAGNISECSNILSIEYSTTEQNTGEDTEDSGAENGGSGSETPGDESGGGSFEPITNTPPIITVEDTSSTPGILPVFIASNDPSGFMSAIPVQDGDGSVLGDETDNFGSTLEDGSILGQTASAQDASSDPLKAFGVLWYWWLVAFAVFASAWWLIAAKRRKQNDDLRI